MKAFPIFAAALIAGVAAMPAVEPEPEVQKCEVAADCVSETGLALDCVENLCVPAMEDSADFDSSFNVCTKDADCIPAENGVALKCVSGQCVPDEGPFPDNNMVVPEDCPEPEPVVDLGVCKDLPFGFCKDQVMIPNVPYTVPAMYGCTDKCEEMTIWCEVDNKHQRHVYWYCCGDECKGIPEQRNCTVDGEEYIVGEAQDIELDGKNVTMWCTSEDEYVTCSGDECGSAPELTPPGLEICLPEEKPCEKDCDNKPTVEKPSFGPCGDVTPVVDALNEACKKCVASGAAYNLADRTCAESPKQCRSVDCIVDAAHCPYEVKPCA